MSEAHAERKRRSRSRSYSRSRSASRSPSRSRSRSYRKSSRAANRRSRSRSNERYSRSRSRSRSHSRSPMSNRRRHIGPRENPPESKCIGVFGLSFYTTERDLKDFFNQYAPIDDIRVVIDHQTGKSRGFAFLYFKEVDDAAFVKEKCNGLEIDGRPIRIDYSITKRPHTPTPGVYMGRPTFPKRRGGSYGRRSPSPTYSRSKRSYSRSRSRSRERSYSRSPHRRY